MGKSHCICHEDPCVCFNGWGRFTDEAALFRAIDTEIRGMTRREPWHSTEWEQRALDVALEGYEMEHKDQLIEILELADEGYTPSEIARIIDDNDLSVGEIHYIIRANRAKEKRKAREKRKRKAWRC